MWRYRMHFVLACTFIVGGVARAEDWPSRAITLVVPYPAGGPTDVIGRLFAEQMSASLGLTIVVENIAGAGGMTGANRVAQATPDGIGFCLAEAETSPSTKFSTRSLCSIL